MPIRSCLLDTNILLRISKRIGWHHPLAARAVDAMNVAKIPLFYTHQNIAEFWNVMTRPGSKNGFGLSTDRAEFEVSTIEAGMNLLSEGEAVYRYWRNLLLKHEIRGVQVHDARLVATMHIHGISHILTFNTNDFRRFADITAVHPSLIENGLI